MLKVNESVNGKFDIVLSDGYRSQLHSKGKAPAKSDLNGGTQSRNMTGKATIMHQQVNQKRRKNYKQAPSVSKIGKSSKTVAPSGGRLSGKKTQIKNKSGNSLENSAKIENNSLALNENVAFVTKKDLANLLETLTNGSSKDLPTELSKRHQTMPSDLQDNKISSTQDKTTTQIKIDNLEENIHQHVEQANHKQIQKLESVLEPVTEVPSTSDQKDSTSYASMEIKKPTAMRSSFAIGAPGLVIDDSLTHDDKVARHKQWVKELDLQIQKKREKEQLLRKNQLDNFFPQTERSIGSVANKPRTDDSAVRTVGETSQQQERTESLTGNVRGRGLMSIMVSTNEAQRQKIFEHQKAIELQVEDRKRQKREERELRLREDAMENDRLAKERAELQKQFEEEARKLKEKEEQAKRRTHILQEGISKAHESAQQLKREKRRNHLQSSATGEVNNKSSRNHDNRREEESNQNISSSDKPNSTIHSNTLTRSGKPGIVPPLALSRSYSPLNTSVRPNHNITSRLSDSMSKIKPNLLSAHDVNTSYSDPGSLGRSHDLIHRWVEEDVGSCNLIDNKNLVFSESSGQLSSMNAEVIIPFHRTASATLFTETSSLQENNSSDHGESRKHHKKDRSIPEVHPTKTSLLRKKATVGEIKNSSFTNRRYKETADAPQKTLQSKGKKLSRDEKETKNIPTRLSSQSSPTPHQEKILEQLSALRKGLLIKDQELKTRIFQINEYEIST